MIFKETNYFSLNPSPPWPPRPCQFGARLFQFRLEPRPVAVQLSVAVGQRPQFIEHGCDVARHADLIGLGMVSLGARILQRILQLGALLDHPRLIVPDPLQLSSMSSVLPLKQFAHRLYVRLERFYLACILPHIMQGLVLRTHAASSCILALQLVLRHPHACSAVILTSVAMPFPPLR